MPSLRTTLLPALALTLALPAAASPTTAFRALADRIVEDTLRFSPEGATRLGDHRRDGQLRDASATAIRRQIIWARHMSRRLRAVDPGALPAGDRVDRAILLDNLDSTIQDLAELQGWRREPGSYNPGDAIDALLSRDFAPLERRLVSVKQRLLQIPALLDAARANLEHPPRLYTEVAIQQFQGTLSLVREQVGEAAAKAGRQKELAPAQAVAARALEDFIAWMKTDLLPRSTGDFRIGPAAFRKKLRTTLSSGLAPEAILARAEATLRTTREEMAQVARPLFASWFPGRIEPDDRAVIKAVLDRIAEKHPDNATIAPLASRDLEEATAFVRAKGLVTVPDAPVKVIVMPEYARGGSVAYCDSPGALEARGTTFFAISPTPGDWSRDRVDSFFREYNDAMVQNLTVHEAMPGHYLQLALANAYRDPTRVRTLFGSGLFAEGWAVYAEQLMARAGYGGPEVHMQQLKMRLRVTINAILDQKIHAMGMTEKEALALMRDEGFQEEGEAVGKWKRACLSSTQLSTYFVGAAEMDSLRAEAEARAAKAGRPFDQRAFHDQLLAFGTPPPKYLRMILTDLL